MNSTAVLDSAAHSHHDLHLVVLAGLICLFACYTALTLLGNARELTSQSRRWLWCAAAALVAGCGVWATHFVAMLAWRPGFQTEYDINLTLWSFALAVAGAWAGIALVLTGKLAERTGATVGGAVIGAATVVMHYTGMAAIRMPAMMHQDRLAMAISIIIGIGLGAAAFRIAIRAGLRQRLTATAAFTASICGLHFTGMAGVSLVPDPVLPDLLLDVSQHVIAPTSLAVAIAAVTIMIVGFGLAGSIIDQHLTSRAQLEAARLRRYITELEATQRELKATAAELTSALETAAAASQTKSHFLANMSHELRTPLNAIIGFADLMVGEIHGPLGNDQYRDYAQLVSDSGSHLLSLINDVLDLARLDASQFDLADDTIEVERLLRDSVRMISLQADKAEVAVSWHAEQPRFCLKADSRRMRQVLLNLLSNAVKFTPPGGSVNLEAKPDDSGFTITVSDTGIGMTADDIPIALERFGQIDNGLDRRFEGTGLGLPLAKLLMEVHGGRLELNSEIGRGTSVTMLFPPARVVIPTAALSNSQ